MKAIIPLGVMRGQFVTPGARVHSVRTPAWSRIPSFLLRVFQYHKSDAGIVTDDKDEPWFVGKDVAEGLGYTWHRGLMAHIPEEWKGVNPIDTLGGTEGGYDSDR